MISIIAIASILIAQTVADPQYYYQTAPRQFYYPTAPSYPIRIVGGSPATANEFPYQISLRYSGSHICGGSIISATKVLTAAHCIIANTPLLFSIKAGMLYRSRIESTNQIRTVSAINVHAQYNSDTTENDIAVLTLLSPLTLNAAVNAITLAPAGSEVATGTELVVTGWGTTSEGGTTSDVLLKVNVPVVSQEMCRAAYGTSAVTDGMMCAGITGKDSCQGDSGGPLATTSSTNRTLIGITSWGVGCARDGYPGVYTKVAAYRPWIQTYAGV